MKLTDVMVKLAELISRYGDKEVADSIEFWYEQGSVQSDFYLDES